MKTRQTRIFALLFAANLIVHSIAPLAFGRTRTVFSPIAVENFSDQELDHLLGPIALYPDPLLAQVIPAATFIDQVAQANQVLKGKVNETVIQSQAWDVSVKSVAHYPQVLKMMADQRDWSIAIGQAY